MKKDHKQIFLDKLINNISPILDDWLNKPSVINTMSILDNDEIDYLISASSSTFDVSSQMQFSFRLEESTLDKLTLYNYEINVIESFFAGQLNIRLPHVHHNIYELNLKNASLKDLRYIFENCSKEQLDRVLKNISSSSIIDDNFKLTSKHVRDYFKTLLVLS